jgi:uncharacterized tellurite resistance protein B-like protein
VTTIKFKTPIDSMDARQKEWFATAMVSMILADGDVSEGEVDSLMGTFSVICNPDGAARLKKFLQYKTMPDLTAFSGWSKNPKAKALILIDLMETAISDRSFSPKEREQFHRIGKLLGFAAAQVEQFINLGEKAVAAMV